MAIEFQLDSINGKVEEVSNVSKQLQLVNLRCLTLERLLLFGEVSSVPRVVRDFKTMSHISVQ